MAKYGKILKKEELFWFQKSRAKWLVDGERNTRFFSYFSSSQIEKRSFSMLQGADGNWDEEPAVMQGMVRDFFVGSIHPRTSYYL